MSIGGPHEVLPSHGSSLKPEPVRSLNRRPQERQRNRR